MKRCTKCKTEKEQSEFYGTHRDCKICGKKASIEFYHRNKERYAKQFRDYYLSHKEQSAAQGKEYRIKNKEALAEYSKEYRRVNKVRNYARGKEYRILNRDEINARAKVYYQENKEKIALYGKMYGKKNRVKLAKRDRERRKIDIQFRLAWNLRTRLRQAIKSNAKRGSAVGDLGCSIQEFKFYLEGKFKDGMTWENWSKTGWHIDHMIPLSFFDLTDREQFLRAVHYTNLQPLWARENLTKHNKITTSI